MLECSVYMQDKVFPAAEIIMQYVIIVEKHNLDCVSLISGFCGEEC